MSFGFVSKLVDWKGFYLLTNILRGFVAFLFAILFLSGNTVGAITLASFLVISYIVGKAGARLPSIIHFLIISTAVFDTFVWVREWERRLPLLDDVTHLITGFILTLTIGYLFTLFVRTTNANRFAVLILVVSFGIALGALWEIFEWVMGFVIGMAIIESVDDTIVDLIMDSLGAMIAGVVIFVFPLKRKA